MPSIYERAREALHRVENAQFLVYEDPACVNDFVMQAPMKTIAHLLDFRPEATIRVVEEQTSGRASFVHFNGKGPYAHVTIVPVPGTVFASA